MTRMRDRNARDHDAPKRIGCIAFILLTAIVPVDLLADSPQNTHPVDSYYSGKQGQILVVKIPIDREATHVQGTFLGRSISFFPDTGAKEPNGFVGLLGIDLQDEPGIHELIVESQTE